MCRNRCTKDRARRQLSYVTNYSAIIQLKMGLQQNSNAYIHIFGIQHFSETREDAVKYNQGLKNLGF